MNKLSLLSLCVAGVLAGPHAMAAPLDALLSANPPATPGSGKLEASYDVVNRTVDIFGIRDNDEDFAGTNVGDYHGAHIRGGIAVTPRLWLDGGLWQRRVEYRGGRAEIHSWQAAGQYKFLEAAGARPAMAVRLGAWGNAAGSLQKSTPSRFQGVALDSVGVADPEDRQLQLDLIATWPVTESLEFSTFAGAGKSRVKVGTISGTATQNGCRYNLAFGPSAVVGTVAQPCGGNAVVERFESPYSALGVDPYAEAKYRANYAHVGLSGKWTRGPWRLQGGYQFQVLDRKGIDDTIESRAGRTSKNNHILVGEIAYQVTRHLILFTRGQYMSNQFTGEIPFTYNGLTASGFDKHYGILSVGLELQF